MKKILITFFSIALCSAVQVQSSNKVGGAGKAGSGGGTLGGGGAGTSLSNASDAPNKGPTVDASSVIVQFKGDPLSTYSATKPPPGKKIDFNSNTVKSYRAQLAAIRKDFNQWLQANAPKAKITSHYDISLNAVAVQLNGTAKSTIEQAPQAAHVEYQGIYYPDSCGPDPDLGIISAIAAWSENGGSAATAGAGVKVAIIDSGIDITHPCFSDAGYPPATRIYDSPADAAFTNNKVIAAKVFNNNAVVAGYTAEAIQEHGTHVAGTVGCNYQTPATVNGVTIPYCPSGVAPKVLLGNYNVFPANVTNARSEDILNALEAAYTDGFDIDNMSLGGGASGTLDLLTKAVDDLDQAGFISAVAAGNSGPGYFTIESPGSAARALTAGASSVPHFIGAPLTFGHDTYGLAAGDFPIVTSDLTANWAVVTETGAETGPVLSTACSTLPVGSLTGKIAAISRGDCSFSQKIQNVQAAGAIAAIVVNNVAGDPVAMGQDGTPNQPTIPAYMTSSANRAALTAASFTETYDGGSDVGVWLCTFSTPRIIEPSGGNPGAYLQQGGFSTHTPTWATASTRYQPGFNDTFKVDSVFTGDWAGAGVASISADLNIIQAGGWGPDRAVTLKLLQMDDTGFNVNFEATYTLPDLGKTPPVGWHTYSFPVNANSSKIPHGWVFTHGDGTPGTNAEWPAFLHRIDLTSIGYYKPGYAYIGFGSWTLGIDNIRVETVSKPTSATIGSALEYFLTLNADIMASFSGEGPTAADFRVKPDVVAPGVNVLSSIPLSFCGGASCWAFFQGTSMATPHLAGSAAVVLAQHPGWTAAQIRSAIVNTADQNVLKKFSTGATETDVNIIGNGRDNLLSAVSANVGLDPVSVSFGSVPSISSITKTYNVTLTNLTGSLVTFSLSVGSSTGTGVSYSVTPNISLGAGDSGSATVTMTAIKGSSFGGHQAKLTVSSGDSEVAHAAVFTYVQ
jgi:subtilisin family serine protease